MRSRRSLIMSIIIFSACSSVQTVPDVSGRQLLLMEFKEKNPSQTVSYQNLYSSFIERCKCADENYTRKDKKSKITRVVGRTGSILGGGGAAGLALASNPVGAAILGSLVLVLGGAELILNDLGWREEADACKNIKIARERAELINYKVKATDEEKINELGEIHKSASSDFVKCNCK